MGIATSRTPTTTRKQRSNNVNTSVVVSIVASAVAAASLGVAVHAVNVASAAPVAAVSAPVAYSPPPSSATLNTVVAPAPAGSKTTPPKLTKKQFCRDWKARWGSSLPGCKAKPKKPRPAAPSWNGPSAYDLNQQAMADMERMRLEQRIDQLERDARRAELEERPIWSSPVDVNR